MAKLIQMIKIATDNKPKFGDPCNSCGWCCLTEVCSVGQELTGSSAIPCSLLESTNDGKHLCKLATNEITRKELGIGTGCCAKTQDEAIAELMG